MSLEGGDFSPEAERVARAQLRAAGIGDDPPGGWFVRANLSTPRWPGSYLTPDVAVLLTLWRAAKAGYPPRTDGTIHWPAPLVEALLTLDTEAARIGGSRGRNSD